MKQLPSCTGAGSVGLDGSYIGWGYGYHEGSGYIPGVAYLPIDGMPSLYLGGSGHNFGYYTGNGFGFYIDSLILEQDETVK